jgi:hypothetical protein
VALSKIELEARVEELDAEVRTLQAARQADANALASLAAEASKPVLGEVTVALSTRGDVPFFYAVNAAQGRLFAILVRLAEADPNRDITVIVQ